MQAAAQKWVDSSISKTTNVPEDISFEDFKSVYLLAWDMGCKGCTTYRPNDITGSILSVGPKPEVKEEEDFQPPEGWGTLSVIGADGQHLYAHERIGNVDLEETDDGDTHMTVTLDLPVVPVPTMDLPPIGDEEVFQQLRVKEKTQRHIAAGFEPLVGADFSEIEKRVLAQTGSIPHLYPGTEISVNEEPQARPEELPGVTYKLKFGTMEHAVYVTITDIIGADGQRRPFEVFFNTKAVDHTAWMTAMARMISAIFRRPHDSRFIAQELKEVFDPTGGAYHKGKYVPSIHAAIGGIIEQHMDAIGYTGGDRVKLELKADTSGAMAQLAQAQESIRSAMKTSGITGTGPVDRPTHKPCPTCASFNLRHDNGCPTCLDCGWSKCI
jgi:ribonucleoside-diphosphate reductase alpha chain